ncbi:TCB2 transposase, partial [Polyodon spathula]|nr:TCB2 transposase [Polyodon spathula]
AVQALLKKHKETGNVEDRRRSGRPRKLTAEDERHIMLTSLRTWKMSSSTISSALAENSGTLVHPSTVQRSLVRSGLRGRLAAKKPYLRRGNKAKRLNYARKHRNWGAEKWQQVLWTDESKFEIFGCSRRQFVRRRAGERYTNECLQATVKHGGGSLQVWGCISANGVGDLVRINGLLNAEKYRQILIHHAIPSGRHLIGPKFILQHDNDPKHTAKVIKNYLQRKEEQGVLEVMVWPPQSPDLNIIKSVWDYIKREKQLRLPKSTEELWLVLQDVWANLPAEFLQKLCASVPRRIDAVLKAKGGHTKY